jgi:glycosyltransferase involved in cell wall biosynthesis
MKNFLFFISIILIFDLINCQDSQIDKETENEINSFISLNREGKLLSEQKFVQSDKPKISLIIPIYNEVNIMPTIRSIQNQNNQQIEIICIYDNSNDASLKLLKSLQKEDPRMFIIRNRSTRGILYDFIEGALDSNGEYVMFIYPGDFLSNAEALTKLYDMAVKDYNKKLDIVNFQACEIEIIGKKIKINSLISQIDKNNLTQVLKQPEIEDYYYNNMKNKKNEIIFDKLYSKRLIKRISNFIGPNIWNLNINFFHEYIINFANIMKSKSLVYVEDIFYCHLKEKKINEYWEIIDDKLKTPENANKNFYDYMLITERLFDLTDKEPKSIQFKEALLRKIGDENILKALARSLYFDRYLNLFEKYIKWNLIDEDTKIRNQQFVKFILNFEVDIETKYGYIIEEEDDDDDEDDFNGYDYL